MDLYISFLQNKKQNKIGFLLLRTVNYITHIVKSATEKTPNNLELPWSINSCLELIIYYIFLHTRFGIENLYFPYENNFQLQEIFADQKQVFAATERRRIVNLLLIIISLVMKAISPHSFLPASRNDRTCLIWYVPSLRRFVPRWGGKAFKLFS